MFSIRLTSASLGDTYYKLINSIHIENQLLIEQRIFLFQIQADKTVIN